jgi:hypothetical protein
MWWPCVTQMMYHQAYFHSSSPGHLAANYAASRWFFMIQIVLTQRFAYKRGQPWHKTMGNTKSWSLIVKKQLRMSREDHIHCNSV